MAAQADRTKYIPGCMAATIAYAYPGARRGGTPEASREASAGTRADSVDSEVAARKSSRGLGLGKLSVARRDSMAP